jgi:hypothetical protein
MIGVSVALAMILAACSTPLAPSPSVGFRILAQASPGPDSICLEGRKQGTLIESSASGLGLSVAGKVLNVAWPFGFSARSQGGRVALVDADGSVVAFTGDRVEIAGGLGPDGIWSACPGGSVSVEPSALAT